MRPVFTVILFQKNVLLLLLMLKTVVLLTIFTILQYFINVNILGYILNNSDSLMSRKFK